MSHNVPPRIFGIVPPLDALIVRPSVVSNRDSSTPPSAATGQSLYGRANTSATLGTAAAFAYGAKVFGEFDALGGAATDLVDRAKRAWNWAAAAPNVTFYNNDSGSGTQGLGSGQQETDDYGRTTKKAAVHLFEVTQDATYRTVVDQTYRQMHMFQYGAFAYPFELAQQEILLYYAALPGATASSATDIDSTYRSAMNSADNLGSLRSSADPYLAYLKDYAWGSNSAKAAQGSMFYDLVVYELNPTLDADAERAAERYIHYLHGVNPFGMVYLSNMATAGAEVSVNEFYHTWFADGSAEWDRVGTSTYGPPPGFLVGGPNPSYSIDGCCPSSCGSPENNARCAESTTPPQSQPAMKAYKDFNSNWPLDSWQITEPSDGYQAAYIQLLSKFVN
jgi:hypothetical protein